VRTKLILIEGLPGAGKSTTTTHLGSFPQRGGRACRWYLEEDDPHPIACLDFRLENLSWRFCHMESVSRHQQAAAVLMLIDCLEEIFPCEQ